MKTCTKCRLDKDESEYHKDKTRPSGLFPRCKECVKKYTKKYYKKNRAKKIAEAAAWTQANRKHVNALIRANYDSTKEKIRRDEKWARRTPRQKALACQCGAKRRALKVKAFVEHVDKRVVWRRDNKRCYLCNKKVTLSRMHLEHKIPLTRGGVHSYGNCATACAKCNLSKGSRTPEEWLCV